MSYEETRMQPPYAPYPQPQQPPLAAPASPTLADLQAQLLHQTALLEEQGRQLEAQRRREDRWRMACLIWLGVKILLVVVLAVWLVPQIHTAWTQYQDLMTQMGDLTGQVNTYLTQVEDLTSQAQTILTDVQSRLDAVNQALDALEKAFAPVAQFFGQLGG